jgi:hypothetical protein
LDKVCIDGIVRIEQDSDAARGRVRVLKYLKAFRAELGVEEGRSGHIPAGAREARDNAGGNRVATHHHDNGQGRRGLFRGKCPWCSESYEDIDPETHEFGGEFRESRIVPFGPAEIDENVLTFDIAEVSEPVAKSFERVVDARSRGCTEESDAGGLPRLLRACRERPRRRA